VHYDRVAVSFATHEVGGVTLNDCICAAKVEELSA
jgi:4a-hydroxytetrahydrobiopterin dehydratase